MRVVLIDHAGVRIQSVERILVGTERFKLARGPLDHQVIAVDLDPLFQFRRRLDHADSFGMNNPRLITLCGSRENFRARLIVAKEQEQTDRTGCGTLRVLAGNLDVHNPKAPQAVALAEPAERAADDELLPRLKLNRGSRLFTLRVFAEPEEVQRMIRGGFAELVHPVSTLQIA